jgi:uncharacterized protein (UPF0212 family)
MLKNKVIEALEAEVVRLSAAIIVPDISDVDKAIAVGVKTSLANLLAALRK